jgi:seryl-tRNA(Sec) selenium transferase
VSVERVSPDELDRRLRAYSPAVVARIQDDLLVLDLRTVMDDDEAALTEAIRASAQRISAAESDASLSKSPGKMPK